MSLSVNIIKNQPNAETNFGFILLKNYLKQLIRLKYSNIFHSPSTPLTLFSVEGAA